MRFYVEQNDKRFCSKGSKWGLLEQQVFLQNLFSALGTISFILSSLPFLLPKTEKKKDQKKEKIEKIKKKKRQNFLRFFPVDPLIFLPKKKGIQKKKRKNSYSLPLPFPLQSRKGERKEERKSLKNGRKETKRKKKEEKKEDSSFFSPSPIHSRRTKRKKKKEGNDPFSFHLERKENGRKYARFQGHEKQKDLAHHEDEQGLKLCGFMLNKTINDFVQRGVNGVCWNIV